MIRFCSFSVNNRPQRLPRDYPCHEQYKSGTMYVTHLKSISLLNDIKHPIWIEGRLRDAWYKWRFHLHGRATFPVRRITILDCFALKFLSKPKQGGTKACLYI